MAISYFIRHGTTDWVDQQILHGITDIPLNRLGLQQAKKTAQVMKDIQARHLFIRPLLQAMKTAEIK